MMHSRKNIKLMPTLSEFQTSQHFFELC